MFPGIRATAILRRSCSRSASDYAPTDTTRAAESSLVTDGSGGARVRFPRDRGFSRGNPRGLIQIIFISERRGRLSAYCWKGSRGRWKHTESGSRDDRIIRVTSVGGKTEEKRRTRGYIEAGLRLDINWKSWPRDGRVYADPLFHRVPYSRRDRR